MVLIKNNFTLVQVLPQLNVQITEANLSLNNVKFKQDALLKLNLPIKIEFGEIKKLDIRIPWLNIGSTPVEVSIQGLNIILSPQVKQEWYVDNIFDRRYLEETLIAIINKVEAEISGDQQGYFGKLAMKVLDNIHIKIKDIHVRFEDQSNSLNQKSFSFGIVLKLLEVQTTNENWVAQFINRTQVGVNQNLFKLIEIEGLGFYLNPEDMFIIHQFTPTPEKRIQLMEALVNEDEKEVLQFLLRPSNLFTNKLNIVNLSLQVEHQSKGMKKVNVNVNLELVQLKILRSQLCCMLQFFELVSEYRMIQNQQYKTKKFKFLRPIDDVKNAKSEWFRYAYQCIKRNNKAKNGSIREFVIPRGQMEIYESQFKSIISKYCFKKEGSYKLELPENDSKRLIHIMSAVDLSFIKKWTKEHLDPIIQTNLENQSKGFTSWLLGTTKKSQSKIISDEESEAMELEISKIPDYKSGNMTLSLNLSLKEFILDLGVAKSETQVEGIRLYSSGVSASFKLMPTQELTFDLSGSIHEFGINLFSFNPSTNQFFIQESVVVSNKKIFSESSEDQWTIRIKKRPDDQRDIEYDIELNANPLLAIYHKEFVKRAIMIANVTINEEAQNAALDKIQDMKEATSSSIYTIIYKKANRFRINIASPVLVLPLSADSNPLSPVWIIRLGDLKIISEDQLLTTSVVEYERYQVMLDSIRMQYFQKYSTWQMSLNSMQNFRDRNTIIDHNNQEIFSVLEDCSMEFKIGIKQKKAGQLMLTREQLQQHHNKPKLMLSGNTSAIKINLTHSVYNKLVNLNSIFDMSKEDDIQKPKVEEQMQSKQAVLKNAKKIGQLQKRLDPLNQWETYFCVLSGGYLYFYKDASQIMPSTYYYIKGVSVTENVKGGLPNCILLTNRFGECCLSMNNESQYQEWSTKIKDKVYELKAEESVISSNSSVKPGKSHKAVNEQAIVTQFNFQVPELKTLLVDEFKDYRGWVTFSMVKMTLQNIKMKSQSEMTLKVKEINLIDQTMAINSVLIGQKHHEIEDSQQAMDIRITNINRLSPIYTNIDSQILITLNNIGFKMQPVSINEVIKFIRNTKFIENSESSQFDENLKNSNIENTIIESQAFMSELENRNDVKVTRSQFKVSCSTNREILSQINIIMKNITITCLHQDYHNELFRLDSSQLEIDYISKYDHFNFGLRLKDAVFYDMTGYPYTVDPHKYSQDPSLYQVQQREIISIKPQKDDEFGLKVQYETYYENCILKKKGFHSKLKVNFKPITVEFFNEAFMRFFFYLFEQFMGSLLYTDPYSDPVKDELENLKRRTTMRKDTVQSITDLKQTSEIFEMDIRVADMSINIPDRPKSKTYLSLKIKELSISHHIKLKAGRFTFNKDRELFVQSFRMNVDHAIVVFGTELIHLTDKPFNMQIIYENLAYSPLLSKIDPQLIEQANHLRIRFDPLQLTIRQDIYTQILRILDLNINFTDFLHREYYFFKFFEIDEYFKTLENIIGMRIKICFSCLSLRLQHIDQSFLSELMLSNLVLKMTKFRDYKNVIDVQIQNFFVFDKAQHSRVVYTSDNREMLKYIDPEECVIQPKSIKALIKKNDVYVLKNLKKQKRTFEQQLIIKMVMKPNGEKLINIDIKGLRISIKPHILMMVYYFMLNSFPEYDQFAIDKPSYIQFDPEDAPRLEMSVDTKDCLLVFQNRSGMKTLACKGNILFEMVRQNVKEIKIVMDNGSLQKLNSDNIKDELQARNLQEEEEPSKLAIISSLPSKVTSDIVWSMQIKVEDFCPFVCSLNQLNESKGLFDKIKKRQLTNPFNLTYLSTYRLQKIMKSQIIDYGVSSHEDITINRIKAKISLQDLHLIFQIITFANSNFTNEYIKKLQNIDNYIKNQREMIMLFDTNIGRKQTLIEDFRIENIEDVKEQEEDFQELLNQQYEQTIASQMSRFRSTTKAFQNIARKYTIVARPSQANKGDRFKNNLRTSQANQEEYKQTLSGLSFKKSDISSGKQNVEGPITRELQSSSRKQSQLLAPQSKIFSPTSAVNQQRSRKPSIDEFQDARSEIFFSAANDNEEQLKDDYLSPEILQGSFDQKSEIVKQPLVKETVIYNNALANIMSQEWTYSTLGIQILFINDFDNVFCPVVDIDIPGFVMHSDLKNQTSSSAISLEKIKVSYFNPLIGDWEPFIENFQMDYQFIGSESIGGQQNSITIDFPKPININLTDSCLQNIIETYYSWMETPPYQLDEFKNNRKKMLRGSINEIKKSNTGSINDDLNLLPDVESESDGESLADIQQVKLLNSEDFNKVSPYSIRNLTSYPFRVTSSVKQSNADLLDEQDNNNSFSVKHDGRLSVLIIDSIEIQPNQTIDYSVDLDKESNNYLQNNRRQDQSFRTRTGTVQRGFSGPFSSNGGDQRKRFKNEELVTLLFDSFEDIKCIDLNKISQQKIDLIPRQTSYSVLSLMLPNESLRKSIVPEDARQSAKIKKKSKYVVAKQYEKLRYGVVLSKMRKILTIRQEYIINNQTLQEYVIRLTHSFEKFEFKEYILKPDCQFGINSQYYKNYSLQIKLSKTIIENNSECSPQKVDENKQLLDPQMFSESILIEDLIKSQIDSGRLISHDGGLFTYFKKLTAQIKDTFDMTLMPPVSIKNCLPAALEIMTSRGVGEGYIDFGSDCEVKIAGSTLRFEKEEEKHLHIFEFRGPNRDELYVRFRIIGFAWSMIQIKKKQGTEYEDKDIKIKDSEGNIVQICLRVQQTKANFQLFFYAHTVIINQSMQQLIFSYNTLKKHTIAGQNSSHDYCIANKDDSIVAGIGSRYSKGLQIKNPGITEDFSIHTSINNHTHDEDTLIRSQRGGPKSSLISSEKKYQFIYQTYMSLVSEVESLYTKIVCIAPKFIMVNKTSKTICIAQAGSESVHDMIDSGDRREWVWQDSNLSEHISIKKDIEDSDWLWSEPVDINQQGVMTITLRKDSNRFNQMIATCIFKITRKQIEGTTYVIIDEEDEIYPLYRLENLTEDVAIWYVQQNQHYQNEAFRLTPSTIVPFAFIDPKASNQKLLVYFTCNIDDLQHDPDRMGDCHFFEFEDLGQIQKISLECIQTGKLKNLNVSVRTDGCSKIISFCDKMNDQVEKLSKQLRAVSLEQRRIQMDQQVKQDSVVSKIKSTVSIYVAEILVSFVTKITEREDNVMKDSRKEIAILTIQNVKVNKFSSTEQNVDNNKITIQSIQIDNQSAVNPLFPTILQPQLFKRNENIPIIDLELNFKTENSDITNIDALDLMLSGLIIKLDDRFLGYFLTFVNNLLSQLKTNITGLHPIFMNRNDERLFESSKNMIEDGGLMIEIQNNGELLHSEGVKLVASKQVQAREQFTHRGSLRSSQNLKQQVTASHHSLDMDYQNAETNEIYKSWQVKKIDGESKRIFIKDCKLSSLKMEISFLARRSMAHLKSSQSQIQSNLNSWGLTLINIDQAPIKVNHLHQKQKFGYQSDITAMIVTHYQQSLKKNIIQLVGSTEILGNPTKFIITLGNGLSDFKNMPLRGIGITGFMKGAFFGTVSLMKNTVEGTFGFAQSITGQMSKLLLVAVVDEDYLSSREEKLLTEKPRDFVEGVGFGCQTAVDSLKSGLCGVVTRPYVETSRGGGPGFLKGVWSGTTGVFLKPLSGGLDLISKTTEGIKNTVKIFEAQVFKDRHRLPRTFYGNEEQIKAYNQQDSYIIIRILETLDGPFKKDHYIETIKFNDGSRIRFLVHSEEHLILLDAAQKSLKWHINSKMIKLIEKFQNGLMIHLVERYDGRISVPIEINNPSVLQRVFDKLKPLEVSDI